jgi:hypothetical protein
MLTSNFTTNLIVLPTGVPAFAIQRSAERNDDDNIRGRCAETHFVIEILLFSLEVDEGLKPHSLHGVH